MVRVIIHRYLKQLFLCDPAQFMKTSCLTLLHSERPKLYGVLAFLSAIIICHCILYPQSSHLTLLHSEGPKLYGVLAILSAIGLNTLSLHHVPSVLKFNPTALRRAKNLWSFGLSECNRVNYCVTASCTLSFTLLHSEGPKLYRVLTFLSAIVLNTLSLDPVPSILT